MIKKIISLLLCFVLMLTGCVSKVDTSKKESAEKESVTYVMGEEEISFNSLNEPELLTYIEGTYYDSLVEQLDSEKYFVENIDAVYVSKEYIEELKYNSQANIFFGYTIAELNELFQGQRYVFTLGEDGKTAVKAFEAYDNAYEKALKDVAIGTGVILVCATVSVLTSGVAPAVSMVFALSAKEATVAGLSSGVFGAVVAGAVTGIETKDFEEALKAGVLAGSEGFKWGAIMGAISGGGREAQALKGATCNGLKVNEAAIIQRESKYPLDVIKQFKSMEQYNICKKAGLKPKMVNGKTALIRDIDLNLKDTNGMTNLERMKLGKPAVDAKGIPYELHHIGQKQDSTLAILTKSEHMQNGNNLIWHEFGVESAIDRPEFAKQKKQFWTKIAELYET